MRALLRPAGLLLAAGAAAALAQPPVRVLFIGNSYTYYNEMPQTFAALAPAGRKAEVKAVTQGGATLGEMWHREDVRAALEQERWDFVVLQEHSTLGFATRDGEMIINQPDYFWQSVRLFAPDVQKAGAKLVLYNPWSRKHKPEAQAEIDYAYGVAAREYQAKLAPVGRAWMELREKNPEIELYVADGSHPSAKGSLVAACVLAYTIFDAPCLEREGEEVLRGAAMRAVEAQAALTLPARGRRPAFDLRGKPAAAAAARRDYAGLWKGRVWMYREPAEFELEIQNGEGEGCKGTWSVTAVGSGTRSARPLVNCRAREDGFEFTVRDWFEAAVETHRVRWAGDKLSAQVNVAFRTPMRRANGTWQASRAPAAAKP